MPTYAAFLRGINVGVHHRVTNDELRSIFSAIGLGEVETFRASGNLAFTAPRRPLADMTLEIEAALERSLGYPVAAFLRAAQQMREIAAMQPFDPELVEASPGKLQVSILARLPPAPIRGKALELAGDEDLLAFGQCELYWLPSGGILDSALDLNAIERMLGPSTRRTKNTIEQMAAKHFAG
jgi:uncharacterized protein (DUF1697 family)